MNEVRFSRQIILGPVGAAGQEAISRRTLPLPEGETELCLETARRYALGAGYASVVSGGAEPSPESLEAASEFRSQACRDVARGALLVLADLGQLLALDSRAAEPKLP